MYHADAMKSLNNIPAGTYKKITLDLKKNLNEFNIPLIHLTLNGFEGWGDENFFFNGDPEHIILNREKTFIEFLKNAQKEEHYWFIEPDTRLMNIFPNLDGDLALLYRNDPVPISPAWRLAKKTALPFFEEILECFNYEYKEWNGDSWAFRTIWEKMNKPELGKLHYNGLDIELREYKDYCKRNSKYSTQWKGRSKMKLLEDI